MDYDYYDYGQQNIQDFTDAQQPHGHPLLSVLAGAAEGFILGAILMWIWRSAFGKIVLLSILAGIVFIWFTY